MKYICQNIENWIKIADFIGYTHNISLNYAPLINNIRNNTVHTAQVYQKAL